MFTNYTGISLPLAVWLASDDYDVIDDPNTFSATALLKPIRALVLGRRLTVEGSVDIEALVPARMGTAVHSAVEKAWKEDHRKALKLLGYPDHVIHQIHINPEVEMPPPAINVYMEQRLSRTLSTDQGTYTITGKPDMILDGQLYDFKTTSTFSWVTGSNDWDYTMQGSIYRWINPKQIREPNLHIEYLFKDWSAVKAKADPKGYPPKRILTKKFPLQSQAETERFLLGRLTEMEDYQYVEQEALPRCKPSDLWQDSPKWAYFANPAKLQRATRLFDLEADAQRRYADDGCKGVVVKREAEVKRCAYCAARPICTQAEEYQLSGLLKL